MVGHFGTLDSKFLKYQILGTLKSLAQTNNFITIQIPQTKQKTPFSTHQNLSPHTKPFSAPLPPKNTAPLASPTILVPGIHRGSGLQQRRRRGGLAVARCQVERSRTSGEPSSSELGAPRESLQEALRRRPESSSLGSPLLSSWCFKGGFSGAESGRRNGTINFVELICLRNMFEI